MSPLRVRDGGNVYRPEPPFQGNGENELDELDMVTIKESGRQASRKIGVYRTCQSDSNYNEAHRMVSGSARRAKKIGQKMVRRGASKRLEASQ